MSVSMVTGANRGIGLELVKRFVSLVQEDNVIIACSRSMSTELEEQIKHPKVHHFDMDISSQSSVDAAFEKVSSLLGGRGINLLVNNAAILNQSASPMVTPTDSYLSNFDVNVVGTHRVTQKFSELLYLAAQQNPDKLVGHERAFCLNISSNVGSMENTTSCWHSAYRVSKAALNMLTKCTAIEFLEKDVLCCAVHPGWVQTGMGGPNALITTSSCVDDLMNVLKSATKEHSGRMVRSTDNEIIVIPF